MNKKYLLLIIVPISVITYFSITNYYSDECNFNICFNEEFFKNHDEYQAELDYIFSKAPAGSRTIESAYIEANGDVEKAIEIIKERNLDGVSPPP